MNEQIAVTTGTAEPGATAPRAQGPILLDYRRAAAALGIGQRTLAALVADGRIPTVRIGVRVLFRPAALAAWAEAQEGSGATSTDGE